MFELCQLLWVPQLMGRLIVNVNRFVELVNAHDYKINNQSH